MHRLQPIQRFQFYDHFIFHEKTQAMATVQLQAFVNHRQRFLAFKRQVTQGEFLRHVSLIGCIQQARSKLTMEPLAAPIICRGELSSWRNTYLLSSGHRISFLSPCPPCLSG